MKSRKKEEIITFKIDAGMSERLRRIPNRSEFIRAAIQSAFGNLCPLCNGTGTLSLEQKMHWQTFTINHSVETCDECNAIYLVCGGEVRKQGACGRM